MKKAFVLIILVWVSVYAISQDSKEKKYIKSMTRTLTSMEGVTDTAELADFVVKFEKKTIKYPGHWLPYYYASNILTTVSFYEGKGPKKDEHLLHSQALLDSALLLAPEESELFVLQALVLASQTMVDPNIRAIMRYTKVNKALKEAEKLNPENPRIYLVDGIFKTVMPEFLGGGTEQAKALFLLSKEKYNSYENKDPLWPHWGEDICDRQLNDLAGLQPEEDADDQSKGAFPE